MRRRLTCIAGLIALCTLNSVGLAMQPTRALIDAPRSTEPAASVGGATLELQLLGSYASNIFDESGAEIVAHDPLTQRLFVINAADNSLDVLEILDPTAPVKLTQVHFDAYGGGANSVAVATLPDDSDDSDDEDDDRPGRTVVAVAVEAENKQENGSVVFVDVEGNFLAQVTVGALPDMLTFSPDREWLLVANEGEPDDDYLVDPEGSISVIDLRGGISGLSQASVRTAGFAEFNDGDIDPQIRIFGPNATVAQDLEPEYIAIDKKSKHAYVTLQENNAMAVVDIKQARVQKLLPFGTKDHSLPGNELDASNQDGAINIANWPVRGMYQPDAIAYFEAGGKKLLITANEGDARDYEGYGEDERVRDLILDPIAFPDFAALQLNQNLGRLNVSIASGVDENGVSHELHAHGARSFSIWRTSGTLLYDSGAALEQLIAAELPDDFNATNDENGSFDSRSDDKGPEPEGVAVGKAYGRTLAFIGLERVGGIAMYDVSNPTAPELLDYLNNRDFSGDAEAGTAGDLGPEGLTFIAAEDSPTGVPLLAVGNEVSGTTTIFAIVKK